MTTLGRLSIFYPVVDMKKWKYIESKSDVCEGKPCFKGTRIPVYVILELMASGDTIDDLIKAYPQLTRAHILEALELSADLVNFEEIKLSA